MALLSLIKIPFIIATTYSFSAAFTNPNPSITDTERRPNDSKTTLFMRSIVHNMAYVRNTFWLATAAEILAILSAEGLLPWAADATNRILMPRGSIHDLRLTPLSVTGTLLAVAGCWLRLKCFRTLRDFFTFEITIREGHRLVTSGPYGFVRHPSYTGSTMIFIGLCFWFTSSGSWVRESGILDAVVGKALVGAFAAVYIKLTLSLLQRMPEEDRLMKASFGKEWEEWASRVPYWLVPGVY